MNALRVILLTILLALLPLQGWAAMGDATTFTTMLSHCPGRGQALMMASRAGLSATDPQRSQHSLDSLERSREVRPDSRLGHPAAGHVLCTVPCGIALATASAPFAWHFVRNAAPMPEFHTRLLACAGLDAPYHPPRA